MPDKTDQQNLAKRMIQKKQSLHRDYVFSMKSTYTIYRNRISHWAPLKSAMSDNANYAEHTQRFHSHIIVQSNVPNSKYCVHATSTECTRHWPKYTIMDKVSTSNHLHRKCYAFSQIGLISTQIRYKSATRNVSGKCSVE